MALVGSDLNCALHLGSFLKLHATEKFLRNFFSFPVSKKASLLVHGIYILHSEPATPRPQAPITCTNRFGPATGLSPASAERKELP